MSKSKPGGMSQRYGPQRKLFETNKKIILASRDVCAICGKPVEKEYKFPHPLSPSIDHIKPISRGGDSSIDNLQLAHLSCNRAKWDKVGEERNRNPGSEPPISNRVLPLSVDWLNYNTDND